MEEYKISASERAKVSGVEDVEEEHCRCYWRISLMRFKIIMQKRHKKKMDEKNKEAALVAGGKHLRDKAVSQIIAGETVRVGGDAVDFSNLWTPSPAMSMFGGSDNGGGGKRSRDERILADMMESERKWIELDSETRVRDNELRMELH